jgi:hypothetical protein
LAQITAFYLLISVVGKIICKKNRKLIYLKGQQPLSLLIFGKGITGRP